MVDLNATWAPTPKSVLRHRRKQERREREAELKEMWREQNAERKMNDLRPLTWKQFQDRARMWKRFGKHS